MPFARSNDVRIHYRLDGREGAPALVLSHSLGADMAMWEPAMAELVRHFRVLRIDTRGHGASDAPPGDYDLAMLAADVLAAMDAAGVGTCAYAGLSLGGMIGLWLALNHPARLSHVALCCTSAQVDPHIYAARIAAVAAEGLPALADAILARWFDARFQAAHPALLGSLRATLSSTSPVGYSGCCAAIRDMNLLGEISAIRAPVLVVNGAHDVSLPAADHGDVIAARIPGAQVVSLASGHIASCETPAALARALIGFFVETPDGRSFDDVKAAWFARGLEQRRKVLGDAWVEQSMARRNSFNTEFQDLITRIAWGEIWTRPGLDHKTRRLLVLAMTIALGRWEEFKLHARSGIEQDGFSVEELKEVIHQAAVYCGVPAANTAMHEAETVLKGLGRLDSL